jgi:hypothetical protein
MTTTLDCTIVPVEVRNIPEISVRIPSLHLQLYKLVLFLVMQQPPVRDFFIRFPGPTMSHRGVSAIMYEPDLCRTKSLNDQGAITTGMLFTLSSPLISRGVSS